MKKSFLFTFVLICLLVLSGCKNHEIYKYAGENEYIKIEDCYLEIYDDSEIFHGGTLKLKDPSQFENIYAFTVRRYILFDDGTTYSFSSMTNTSDDSSRTLDLDGLKLGTGNINRWLLENKNSTLCYELKTTDVNGIENVYKVEMELK